MPRILDDLAKDIIADGRKMGHSPLRAVREFSHMSVKGLAGATGMDVEALRLCEEAPDTFKPSPEDCLAIATLVGISPDVLFGDWEEAHHQQYVTRSAKQ